MTESSMDKIILSSEEWCQMTQLSIAAIEVSLISGAYKIQRLRKVTEVG